MIEPQSREPRQRSRMAGGVFIALGLIGGIIVGTLHGQPSIGLLAGVGAGLLLALLVWLVDRRR